MCTLKIWARSNLCFVDVVIRSITPMWLFRNSTLWSWIKPIFWLCWVRQLGLAAKAVPFLTQELRLIEQRLDLRSPLLGICFGAQLMARGRRGDANGTQGDRLFAGHADSRRPRVPIGWVDGGYGRAALARRPVCDSKCLESLGSTSPCSHQAFAPGDYALGLQFHLEADPQRIDEWLVGHAVELAQASVDPSTLRTQAQAHGARLKTAAEAAFGAWLDQVEHYSEGAN